MKPRLVERKTDKGVYFIKKLWCCVGGEGKRIGIVLSTGLSNMLN